MGFAKDVFSSVAVAEFMNRSISFLFAKSEEQASATVQEDLQLLRRLLMRSDTIVEEAERRDISNPYMLQQLKALRDKTYRGYYVLDTVRCRALPREGGSRSNEEEEEEEEEEEVEVEVEVNSHTFTMSRFNPAKRVRYPSGGVSSEPTAALNGGADASSSGELRRMVCSLEAMIGGIDEFVRCLMGCPPLYREPYSAHVYMDRIIEFLLQTEVPRAGNLGVLPIIGPAHIGKSTLVEHVCHDVRVRSHFSLIMVYSGNNDLKDETVASFRDKCVIKHQNDQDLEGRLLIAIEFLEDVDEETWKRLYSCERSMAQGSKMIITSRSEEIVRFGTTQALRLKCLPIEAYWYLLALEMANLMQGSFMFAYHGATLLNSNFNTQSWTRILTRVRQYIQKNALIGEYHDDIKAKNYPRYTWNVVTEKPDKYFMLHDIYQRGSGQKVPDITYFDLQAGRAQPPPGKYEILFTKSRIPPYFNYICTCEICDM